MELQLQGDCAQGEKEEQREELHLAIRERERLCVRVTAPPRS